MAEYIRKKTPFRPAPAEESEGEAAGPAPSLADLRARIQAANDAYVARHPPDDLPRTPRLSLAIVTCVDCRLTGRLEEALGVRPGDALVVRVAGSALGGTDDLSRSLAVAVFAQGVRNVLVIGHTDCGVAKIDPLTFGDRLAERGISRFALGSIPLREWLGIFASEAENVRETVRKLRASAILPRDVQVAGALFGTHTGELIWLDEGA